MGQGMGSALRQMTFPAVFLAIVVGVWLYADAVRTIDQRRTYWPPLLPAVAPRYAPADNTTSELDCPAVHEQGVATIDRH